MAQTLQAGKKLGVLKTRSFDKVVVDTPCMEKAIAHPVDSKLFNRMREHLVKQAESLNITLRQNYNQVAPELVKKAARYGHAKQYARLRKVSNKLRTTLGRVIRDIERKTETSGTTLTTGMVELLTLAKRLKTQQRNSKATKRWMKRRNSVEPIIGHLKAGHKMQRNWLKGQLGDIMAPILAASGFNLKKILRALALFAPKTYRLIMALLTDFYAKAKKSLLQHRQINSSLVM